MIPHQELLEIMDYDPETGIFVWSKPRPKIQVGQRVGYKHYKGYLNTEILGKFYSLHRLAWFYVYGEWPSDQLDHINCQKDDNRIANLRLADPFKNQHNRPLGRMNTSGFKGVRPIAGRFDAYITAHKKHYYLGRFDTPEQAHAAYTAAAKKHFGEFARAA